MLKFLIDECLTLELVEVARRMGFPESSHVVWIGNLRIHLPGHRNWFPGRVAIYVVFDHADDRHLESLAPSHSSQNRRCFAGNALWYMTYLFSYQTYSLLPPPPGGVVPPGGSRAGTGTDRGDDCASRTPGSAADAERRIRRFTRGWSYAAPAGLRMSKAASAAGTPGRHWRAHPDLGMWDMTYRYSYQTDRLLPPMPGGVVPPGRNRAGAGTERGDRWALRTPGFAADAERRPPRETRGWLNAAPAGL